LLLRSFGSALRRGSSNQFNLRFMAAASSEALPGDEQITGREKLEMEASKEGVKLFDMDPLKGPFGTADAPVIVESAVGSRIVGCVGGDGEDSHELLWMNLDNGHPRSCSECGQVFVINHVKKLENFMDKHPEIAGAAPHGGHH